MALQGVTKPNNLYSDLARLFAVLLSIAVEHADDEGEIVVSPVIRRYGFKPGDNVFEQRAARDPVNIPSLRMSGAEDIEGIRMLPESTLLLEARMASEGGVDDQEGNNVLWYVQRPSD